MISQLSSKTHRFVIYLTLSLKAIVPLPSLVSWAAGFNLKSNRSFTAMNSVSFASFNDPLAIVSKVYLPFAFKKALRPSSSSFSFICALNKWLSGFSLFWKCRCWDSTLGRDKPVFQKKTAGGAGDWSVYLSFKKRLPGEKLSGSTSQKTRKKEHFCKKFRKNRTIIRDIKMSFQIIL